MQDERLRRSNFSRPHPGKNAFHPRLTIALQLQGWYRVEFKGDLFCIEMYAKKRKADLSNPPPKRRKSKASAIEEISFDPDARQDYLTGFHKRKLQRAKYAREQAMERGRLEKIEARKNVRQFILGNVEV